MPTRGGVFSTPARIQQSCVEAASDGRAALLSSNFRTVFERRKFEQGREVRGIFFS